MNASVKNNVATLIVHIHVHNKPIVKTLHHAINTMSTEAEFLVLRCSINQSAHLQNISKIVVITDSIYVAKKIFNPLSHPLQNKQPLFSTIFENSFLGIMKIQLNSGNAQVNASGPFTIVLTLKQSLSISLYYSLQKIHRTLARNLNVMISSILER